MSTFITSQQEPNMSKEPNMSMDMLGFTYLRVKICNMSMDMLGSCGLNFRVGLGKLLVMVFHMGLLGTKFDRDFFGHFHSGSLSVLSGRTRARTPLCQKLGPDIPRGRHIKKEKWMDL